MLPWLLPYSFFSLLMNGVTDIPQVAATYAVINLNYSIHGALKQINFM
jgi:hypothetical protein